MHNNLLRYLNNGFSYDGVVDSKQGVVGGGATLLCTLIYFSSSACAPIVVVVLNPCTKQLLLPLLTGFMMILT